METTKSLIPIYELELSDDVSLKIHVKKAKASILCAIFFFALTISFIPILFFIYLIICGEGIPLGFIITCIVGFLTSGYLLKLYLWNKYGTEVFIIQKKELVLYYDYKLFKDNFQKIHFESIRVCFEDNGIWMNVSQRVSDSIGNANLYYAICFDLDGKEVKSLGKIPIEEIIKISRYLNNTNQ